MDKVILVQKVLNQVLKDYSGGDIYKEVANRLDKDYSLTVSRLEVKNAAFPIMYGRNPKSIKEVINGN